MQLMAQRDRWKYDVMECIRTGAAVLALLKAG